MNSPFQMLHSILYVKVREWKKKNYKKTYVRTEYLK